MELTHKEIVKNIINWAKEKKAEEIKYYDVKGKTSYTDSIIVCHGTSSLHIKAIAENIIQKAKESHFELISIEGLEYASWILLDFVDIIVHIFNEETRKYYQLEELWKVRPNNQEKQESNLIPEL